MIPAKLGARLFHLDGVATAMVCNRTSRLRSKSGTCRQALLWALPMNLYPIRPIFSVFFGIIKTRTVSGRARCYLSAPYFASLVQRALFLEDFTTASMKAMLRIPSWILG